MKLTCVLVDDERLGRELLRTMIAEDEELAVLGESGSGQDAFALIQSGKPDLLFLDVEMPGMSGIELLEMLRFEGVPMPTIVFVTAYDRYALQAFDAHAVDYLLKPFDEARFRRAVAVAKSRTRADRGLRQSDQVNQLVVAMRTARIPVRSHGTISFVPIDTIDWVEADRNHLKLHVGPVEHTIRETMNSFEQRLAPHPFARIHRSIIVNLNRIQNVQPWYTGEYIVRLDTGKELTMSRSYRKAFFATLGTEPGA